MGLVEILAGPTLIRQAAGHVVASGEGRGHRWAVFRRLWRSWTWWGEPRAGVCPHSLYDRQGIPAATRATRLFDSPMGSEGPARRAY